MTRVAVPRIVLTESGRTMTRTDIWLAGFAVVGVVAGVLAAGLLWMVVAHPLAVVQALGGIR